MRQLVAVTSSESGWVDWWSGVLPLFLLLFALAGIIGNTLVCIAICVERKLRSVTSCYLTSLASADLVVCTIVMPCFVFQEYIGCWPFNWSMCSLWQLLDVMMCTSSIMHMCLISIDRYHGITKPIKARNKTRRGVLLSLLSVWLLSFTIASPLALLNNNNNNNDDDDDDDDDDDRNSNKGGIKENTDDSCVRCGISDAHFMVYGSVAAFLVPLLLMWTTLLLTVRALNNQAAQLGIGRSTSSKYKKVRLTKDNDTPEDKSPSPYKTTSVKMMNDKISKTNSNESNAETDDANWLLGCGGEEPTEEVNGKVRLTALQLCAAMTIPKLSSLAANGLLNKSRTSVPAGFDVLRRRVGSLRDGQTEWNTLGAIRHLSSYQIDPKPSASQSSNVVLRKRETRASGNADDVNLRGLSSARLDARGDRRRPGATLANALIGRASDAVSNESDVADTKNAPPSIDASRVSKPEPEKNTPTDVPIKEINLSGESLDDGKVTAGRGEASARKTADGGGPPSARFPTTTSTTAGRHSDVGVVDRASISAAGESYASRIHRLSVNNLMPFNAQVKSCIELNLNNRKKKKVPTATLR